MAHSFPFRIGYTLGRQGEAEPVLAAGKGRNNRIERPREGLPSGHGANAMFRRALYRTQARPPVAVSPGKDGRRESESRT